jgi:cysteinyl-tRNA synthetase
MDVLRRITEHVCGKPVLYCMGVTDVDDKIINRSVERGMTAGELAKSFEHEFLEDMTSLGVRPATVMTRVTNHIPEILEYVSGILDQKLAYVAADGVYFDTQAFGGRYGKLMPAAHAERDVEADGLVHNKRNARDFALWKLSSAQPNWQSPWGTGRPGWHIECSAMTHSVFGGHVDIHSGGIDLAFPHHCNEIAQSEAFNGYNSESCSSAWVHAFLHTGHLHIAGRKMSKSLKNFISIRAMLKEHADTSADQRISAADQFRMYCVAHHYRSNITYNEGVCIYMLATLVTCRM